MSTSKWIWMAVDADEYELPQVIADSAKELAEKYNTSKANVENCAYMKCNGKKTGIKFVIVPKDNDK